MRKFLCFVLTLVLCFGSIIPKAGIVKANERIEVTDENVKGLIVTAALDWLEMIEPGKEFTVGDIMELVTDASDKKEYTASIFYKTIPYGYVVVEISENGIVVLEAQVTPGQEGLYADIVDDIAKTTKKSRKDLNIDKKVNKMGPLNYSVTYSERNGKKHSRDNYGNEYNVREELYDETSYPLATSIFIWSDKWTESEYRVEESIVLKKFTEKSELKSEGEVERITKKYACPVQALLQIAYMEGLTTYEDNYIYAVYNVLWFLCNVSETESSKKDNNPNKVTYGGASHYDYAKGFASFAKQVGYKNTYYKTQKNPSVAWLKDKLEFNRPIIMGYGLNVGGGRVGHAISVLGYFRATKVSSGNTWNYLMVYDGWHKTVSYINYTCVDMMDCKATYYWVK